jgi:ribose 5-phosphate isomerase B
MKIAIGADHGGFELKEKLKKYLSEKGHAVEDCGTYSAEAVDYPTYAYAVAKQVSIIIRTRIMINGAGIGFVYGSPIRVPGYGPHCCMISPRPRAAANITTPNADVGAGA